jgi:hypothetical protein
MVLYELIELVWLELKVKRMDDKYICKHLKGLTALMNCISEDDCFAKLNEDDMYVFGIRKTTRNIVTRQVAIYLIVGYEMKRTKF